MGKAVLAANERADLACMSTRQDRARIDSQRGMVDHVGSAPSLTQLTLPPQDRAALPLIGTGVGLHASAPNRRVKERVHLSCSAAA